MTDAGRVKFGPSMVLSSFLYLTPDKESQTHKVVSKDKTKQNTTTVAVRQKLACMLCSDSLNSMYVWNAWIAALVTKAGRTIEVGWGGCGVGLKCALSCMGGGGGVYSQPGLTVKCRQQMQCPEFTALRHKVET